MKVIKEKKVYKRILFFLIVLFIYSCEASLLPEFIDEPVAVKKEVVKVSFSVAKPFENTRTLVPLEPTFVKYRFEFTGGSEVDPQEVEDGSQLSVELLPGDYTVSVYAYTKLNNLEVVAAEGSLDFTVVSGQAISETISVNSILDGANGNFTYTVSCPEDMERAYTVSFKSFLDRNGEDAVFADTGTIAAGKTKAIEHLVPPGYYFVTVNVIGNAGNALREEVVHIYSGLETTGSFVFDNVDFVKPINLSGKLQASIDGEAINFAETPSGVYLTNDGYFNSNFAIVEIEEDGSWTCDLDSGFINEIDITMILLTNIYDLVNSYVLYYEDESFTVHDEDVDFGTMKIDFSTITLSGTIDYLIDGVRFPADNVQILSYNTRDNEYTPNGFETERVISVGNSEIDGSWVAKGSPLNQERNLFFAAQGAYWGMPINQSGVPKKVYNQDVSGIELLIEDPDGVVRLSGSFSLSIDGEAQNVSNWLVEGAWAKDGFDQEEEWPYHLPVIGSVGSTGQWNLATEEKDTEASLWLRFSGDVGGKPFVYVVDAGVGVKNTTVENIAVDYNLQSNSLQSIQTSVGKLIPDFDPGITDYVLPVSFDNSTLQIEAIPFSDEASVTFTPAQPMSISAGVNNIEIGVTGFSGETKTYNLTAIRNPSQVLELDGIYRMQLDGSEDISYSEFIESSTLSIEKDIQADIVYYDNSNDYLILRWAKHPVYQGQLQKLSWFGVPVGEFKFSAEYTNIADALAAEDVSSIAVVKHTNNPVLCLDITGEDAELFTFNHVGWSGELASGCNKVQDSPAYYEFDISSDPTQEASFSIYAFIDSNENGVWDEQEIEISSRYFDIKGLDFRYVDIAKSTVNVTVSGNPDLFTNPLLVFNEGVSGTSEYCVPFGNNILTSYINTNYEYRINQTLQVVEDANNNGVYDYGERTISVDPKVVEWCLDDGFVENISIAIPNEPITNDTQAVADFEKAADGTWFAGIYDRRNEFDNDFILYKTIDQGENWQGVSGFEAENLSFNDGVTKFVFDHNDKLYLVSCGLSWDSSIYTYENSSWVNALSGIGDIDILDFASDGTVWAYNRRTGLLRYRSGIISYLTIDDGLPSNIIKDVYVDEDYGFVWFATDDGIVKITDTETMAFEVKKTNTGYDEYNNTGKNYINTVYRLSSGRLLAGTRDTVEYSDDNGLTWQEYHLLNDTSYIWPNNIKESSNGTIWIGTEWNGIFRSSDNGMNWYHFTKDNKNEFPGDSIVSIKTYGDEVWVASIDESSNFSKTTGFSKSLDNGNSWQKVVMPEH